MTHKDHYKNARDFESKFLAQLQERGHSIKGSRFYGSQGITNVWWVSPQGTHNEAKIRYSSKKPHIAPHQMQQLREFARKVDGQIVVWLVKKQARKTVEMELVI